MSSRSWKLFGIGAPRAYLVAAAFLGLACVWPATGAAQVPAAAAAEFQRALQYFRAGSYPDALRVAEPLGRRYREIAEIQHLLAIVLDLNRKPEAANRHFLRAVELQPDSAAYRTNLGTSLMRLGHVRAAAEQFRSVLRLDPDNSTASFNLGTILMRQGRLEQARPRLEQAFASQPGIYENAYQLAYCSFLLGAYEAAGEIIESLADPSRSRPEARFLRALTERALGRPDRTRDALRELRPLLDGHPQLQFQAALLLQSQGLLEPAEELLGAAAGQLPAFYPAHVNLARTRQGLGKLAAATRAARAALALEETGEVHLLLGDLLEAQERPLEAVEHFRKAVSLEPTPENFYALGHEFLLHWNWEAARQVFSAGLQRHPSSWRLWIGAGAAAVGLTKHEESTRAFLQAVELRPAEVLGYLLMAQSFDRAEESFDEAVEAFRAFLAREPADPWARYFEALATYRQASRTGGADQLPSRARALARLAAENPDFVEAHLLLGEVQFELGEWSAAVGALRRVIQLDAEQVAAHYRLGLALQRMGQSEEARQTLARYQALKARADQSIGERVATTTRFIVALKPGASMPAPRSPRSPR